MNKSSPDKLPERLSRLIGRELATKWIRILRQKTARRSKNLATDLPGKGKRNQRGRDPPSI